MANQPGQRRHLGPALWAGLVVVSLLVLTSVLGRPAGASTSGGAGWLPADGQRQRFAGPDGVHVTEWAIDQAVVILGSGPQRFPLWLSVTKVDWRHTQLARLSTVRPSTGAVPGARTDDLFSLGSDGVRAEVETAFDGTSRIYAPGRLDLPDALAAGRTWTSEGGVVLLDAAGNREASAYRATYAATRTTDAYPPVWGRWLYPLAASVAAVPALVLPLVVVRGIFQLLGQEAAVSALNVAWFAFLDYSPRVLWRFVLAPVVLVIAVRLVRRDRLTEAVALSTFSILLLSDAIGSLAGLSFLQDRTTTAFGVIAASIALVAAAAMGALRRFDRLRAIGVMTVVLLAVLYPYRNLIEDPTSALAVLSPAVLLVFGLAWRTATEAEFTYASTPKYPQSTRVLLFLANTLLAATGLAYLALARAAGTDADPALWGALGDTVLGDPLYVTGLVTGLWFVVHPAARRNDPSPPAGSTGQGP